jgi:lipoprotein signal peptidase
VGIGPLRTGIFNVADFVLLIGLALIAHDGMTARD